MKSLKILALIFCLILLSVWGCKNPNPYSPDIEDIIKPPDPPPDPDPDPQPLVAVASADKLEGEAQWEEDEFAVTFTGSASGGTPPYSYHWDFGNYETSDLQNPPPIVYSRTGTYTVVLTVTDSAGVIATDTLSIRVYAKHRMKIGVSATCDRNAVFKVKLFLDGEDFDYWGDPKPFGGNWTYSTYYWNNSTDFYAGTYAVEVLFWQWSPFEPDPPDPTYFKIHVVVESLSSFGCTVEPESQESGTFQWKSGDVKTFYFTVRDLD